MVVTYGMGNGTLENDSIYGCIELSPSLQIWGSEKPENMEKAMMLAGCYDQNLHSISEATNGALDVDQFYESFSQSASETCFDTSSELWAEPER